MLTWICPKRGIGTAPDPLYGPEKRIFYKGGAVMEAIAPCNRIRLTSTGMLKPACSTIRVRYQAVGAQKALEEALRGKPAAEATHA